MPAVLITGAAGGLGAATVERFVAGGWTVYAADITAPASRDGVVPLTMDVTSQESVDAAVASIRLDALQCVVNFAGILVVGPMMDVPAERLSRILEINVVGTHRVNRACFDLLRAGRGRVVNISSETGWQRALPMGGPYAMSKHAIEAYSDALRRELMFLGIPVIAVQPGPFRTRMTSGIAAAFDAAVVSGSPFEQLLRRVGKQAAREEAKAHDVGVLAESIWQAATSAHPRARYSVRPDRVRSVLHRLPVPLTDRLLKRALA